MTIGERREVDEIRPRHWERAAERCGFPADRMVAHVKELTARLPDLATKVSLRKAGILHSILDQLVDRIADNAMRIARRR